MTKASSYPDMLILYSWECIMRKAECLSSRGSCIVLLHSTKLISKVGLLCAANRSTRCRLIICHLPPPWSLRSEEGVFTWLSLALLSICRWVPQD